MVQSYNLKDFDIVYYSVSDSVGGRDAINDPVDVMLIQYLLNRQAKRALAKPWGTGDLAVDGVMGTRTHYRLIHFNLTHYRTSARSPQLFEVETFISPIENAHKGTSPVQLRMKSAMGLLCAAAFMTGEVPSSSHLTLVDMPPRLAETLAKNVTII